MKSSLCLLAGFAVTVSLGCGKSDAEKFADSYCAEVAKCCGEAGMPADGKMCHQWSAFAAAGGSYNASAGNACLAEIKAEVSAGTFCAGLSSSGPPQCELVYGTSGNKKVGDTCDFDEECAGAGTGEVACTMSTCTTLIAVGGTCSFTSDCVSSAFCDYNKNVCVARVPAGGACTGSGSAECVDGYYCESSSKQCSAQIANGAPCTTFAMCKSGNCSNDTCEDDGGLSLICGS